jgi:hypothetical protein
MAARWPRAEALAAAMIERTYQELWIESNRTKTACRQSSLPIAQLGWCVMRSRCGSLEWPLKAIAECPKGLEQRSCCSIEDMIMIMDDDTNDQPIVWHCTTPEITACQTADPLMVDATPDDDDLLALMPPHQQTIWPRVLGRPLIQVRSADRRGRRQPHCRERRGIVLDDQRALGTPRGVGGPEVWHFPVTDLGSLREIVQVSVPPIRQHFSYTTISRKRRPIVSGVGLTGRRFRAIRGESMCASPQDRAAHLRRPQLNHVLLWTAHSI